MIEKRFQILVGELLKTYSAMNEIDPIIGRTLPRLLREALADPDTLVVSHLYFQSWGRKPSSGRSEVPRQD